jgi:hypothetical protein
MHIAHSRSFHDLKMLRRVSVKNLRRPFCSEFLNMTQYVIRYSAINTVTTSHLTTQQVTSYTVGRNVILVLPRAKRQLTYL